VSSIVLAVLAVLAGLVSVASAVSIEIYEIILARHELHVGTIAGSGRSS